jgi:outer membrane protein TolC
MTGDMQSTFNELERKLRELEAELRSATAAPEPPPPAPPPPPPPPPVPERSTESLVSDARERVGGLHDQLEELLHFRDQLA